MPTYDYECRHCQHLFEHFQGISEPLLRKCPSCGKAGLERRFGTGIGVVFKGSGFYETDYKRANSKPPAGDGDGGGGKPGPHKAGSGKTDTGSAPASQGGGAGSAAPPPAGSSGSRPAARDGKGGARRKDA